MHKEKINNTVLNNIYGLPAYLQASVCPYCHLLPLSEQLSRITYIHFLLVQENIADE